MLTRLKQLRRAPSKKPESKPVYVKRILDDAGMSRKAVHIDDVEVLEHMDIKGKDDILITFDSQELEHDSIEVLHITFGFVLASCVGLRCFRR